MAAPQYRLRGPSIPLARWSPLDIPSPTAATAGRPPAPRGAPRGPGPSLSPDGGLCAQSSGVYCLNAVYGHPEVAPPPLCAPGLASQDAWQEAHYPRTVVPGPPGADVGARGRGSPRPCVAARVPPLPVPRSRSPRADRAGKRRAWLQRAWGRGGPARPGGGSAEQPMGAGAPRGGWSAGRAAALRPARL